ncbi:MAG: hypothetical protein U0556_03055 [Dehalococcoidia bacterium]
MQYLQGTIFTLATLLCIGATLAAISFGTGAFNLIWALQLAGMAAIMAVLALAAFSADRPVKLKGAKR